MATREEIGGRRLGAGGKMEVTLHGYERSTHDLGYLVRTTMSPGTLVPFANEIALPGDTWDIDLDLDMKTHPTIGPLFGSYKVQADMFFCPLRLYNSLLHNNMLDIGMHMDKVYFPIMELIAYQADLTGLKDPDNSQINPSSILAYLGIRGIGNNDAEPEAGRQFNATDLIAYWDIYKNYYANKMEEIGMVIHNGANAGGPVDEITITTPSGTQIVSPNTPSSGVYVNNGETINVQWLSGTPTNLQYLIFGTDQGEMNALTLGQGWIVSPGLWTGTYNGAANGQRTILYWRIAGAQDSVQVSPQVTPFTLSSIDTMRQEILAYSSLSAPFNVTAVSLMPYAYITDSDAYEARLSSQEGLGIKTYQSDLFNNWIKEEYITGPTGVNEISAVAVVGGKFTMDQLNLSQKVYNYLNRVAVSGGTYEDWLRVTYDHNRPWRAETPVYLGSLIKELAFQEVVSNSQTDGQPLGTLSGKGVLTKKHKGGSIIHKTDEPGIIMGIVSLTPRIDYSQGNRFTAHLKTMADLHKPALDGIGYQDLVTEQMAWWDTYYNPAGTPDQWIKKSAGKQPAWLNYMTNVNRNYGNFAVKDNEMFMTLNRRYEVNSAGNGIKDLTTYIDPVKFNYIFANTSLDAMNFWCQIAVNATVRRKISAKIIPVM